jgi:hypothetical protein
MPALVDREAEDGRDRGTAKKISVGSSSMDVTTTSWEIGNLRTAALASSDMYIWELQTNIRSF